MLQRFIKKLDRSWLAVLCMLTSVKQKKRRKAHQEPFCEFRKVKLSHDWCETLQPLHPLHGLGVTLYRPQ